MTNASHQQAVQTLTGFERFIRLVVERDVLVPKDHFATTFNTLPSTTKSIISNSPASLRNNQIFDDTIAQSSQKRPQTSSTGIPDVEKRIPQPAPRKINSLAKLDDDSSQKNSTESNQQSHFRTPLTNEDFQAMIPKHFLRATNSSSSENSGSMINVTIKQPDTKFSQEIQFPPTPSSLGKVTETITKSTFTETTVTRLTENKQSVVIEVLFLF